MNSIKMIQRFYTIGIIMLFLSIILSGCAKDKAKERGLAASDKFEDHIEKLRTKRDEVKSKIEELQEARDNAWIYLEEDVDNALEELKEALNMSMLNFELYNQMKRKKPHE